MLRLLASLLVLVIAFLVLSSTPHIAESPSHTYERQTYLATELPLIAASTTPEQPATTTLPSEEPFDAETPVEPQEIPPPPSAIEGARTQAQNAVVNILCEPEAGGTMAVSGTGVIIDPRGVILTNAHVAQYVLLSSRDEVNLLCKIRSGSPAKDSWNVELLYIPPEWVSEHAADIVKTNPSGTGEHDYALLLATPDVKSTDSLPFLPLETSISPDIVGVTVALAAYPAEFSGIHATAQFLLSSSTLTPVKNVLTFNENTVDVLSFGAVVLAQGGSSGGAAVNEKGNLVAIISTTSNREFIAERDLRGITLSYINRALSKSYGTSLAGFLAGDVAAQGEYFRTNRAPALAQTIIEHLLQR